MALAVLKNKVKQRLTSWAPPGTRRHEAVMGGARLLQGLVCQSVFGLHRNRLLYVARPVDVYEARSLAAFLRRRGLSAGDVSTGAAEADEPGAARFVLRLLQSRPDLRRRFPRAVLDGAEGEFCQWLCHAGAAECDLSRRAAVNVRTAFTRRLGDRVRQVYDHRWDLRYLFPLALTPFGQRPFFDWLVRCGRAEHGLRFEEIWWFLNEAAEDPCRGVVSTYRRHPEWQEQVPHGLTDFGSRTLLAWVREHYGIPARLWKALAPPALDPQERTLAEDLGANVLGHFCCPSGLGQAVHATRRALEGVGVRTSCRDIPVLLTSDDPHRDPYLGLEQFDVSLLHVAPEPRLDVFYPRAGLASREDVYRIVYWYWELESVPREWARYAGRVQEVWAPTRFIARAMQPVMPIPVVHMPPGLELGAVPRLPRDRFGLPDDRFLFLLIFDMTSVMERKNPLGLLRAYRKAFGRDERTQLVIKITQGDAAPQNLDRLMDAAGAAGATVIDRVLSREDAYGLMNICDCYVSLHRAEGFGFTLAEAMLMGKPVIATGYSGNLDFMRPGNSLLVNFERVPIAEDLPFYPRGAVWAEPSVDHAAGLMRWVYEHAAEARQLGAVGRRQVTEYLSLPSAGRRMRARLEELRR